MGFERCISAVLLHEGGYVNHPADPGGETRYGISKRSYPNEDIRNLTVERAKAIYRRDFWDKAGCGNLPPGIDLIVLDAAINSGIRRSVRWLQMGLGVTADGVIGQETMAALGRQYAPAVIMRAIAIRKSWLMRLGTWKQFGKGWANRLAALEKEAIAMAESKGIET